MCQIGSSLVHSEEIDENIVEAMRQEEAHEQMRLDAERGLDVEAETEVLAIAS